MKEACIVMSHLRPGDAGDGWGRVVRRERERERCKEMWEKDERLDEERMERRVSVQMVVSLQR